MVDFDWEERDEKVPLIRHMLAGSFAGAAEHVLCYPIDTIKTHMQASKGFKASFKKTATLIY